MTRRNTVSPSGAKMIASRLRRRRNNRWSPRKPREDRADECIEEVIRDRVSEVDDQVRERLENRSAAAIFVGRLERNVEAKLLEFRHERVIRLPAFVAELLVPRLKQQRRLSFISIARHLEPRHGG